MESGEKGHGVATAGHSFRAAERFGIDGTPFEKILNIRKNNFTDALDEITANKLFGAYLEQIEKIIDAVDAAGEK